MRFVLLLLVLSSSLALAGAPATPSAFADLPSDPAPAQIVRGLHYWVSNEDRLELFLPAVQDKRGLYVGVGTDQNYLLAAWARADTLVLLDFDQSVVDLHRVYRVLFLAAASPGEFLRLWGPDARAEVGRLLQEGYPDPRERLGALQAYGTARGAVARRLRRVIEQMTRRSLPCFLVEDAEYAHVRRLYQEGRVFLVRGDLTAARSVRAVGQAAAEEQRPLGVLYLSNAEQYFDYGPSFRENMRALPLTEKSVVVRTSGQRGLSQVKGSYYHYNTQSGSSFLAWLADRGTRNVRQMLRQAPGTDGPRGLSRLDAGPPPREARPKAAR